MSAGETGAYLCNLISGVPFHSQEDLGKDLRHVDAVLSEMIDRENTLVRTLKTVHNKPSQPTEHKHTLVPVPPQEVLLLLSDLRQRVSVTHLAELLVVGVRQGVVPGQSVAL